MTKDLRKYILEYYWGTPYEGEDPSKLTRFQRFHQKAYQVNSAVDTFSSLASGVDRLIKFMSRAHSDFSGWISKKKASKDLNNITLRAGALVTAFEAPDKTAFKSLLMESQRIINKLPPELVRLFASELLLACMHQGLDRKDAYNLFNLVFRKTPRYREISDLVRVASNPRNLRTNSEMSKQNFMLRMAPPKPEPPMGGDMSMLPMVAQAPVKDETRQYILEISQSDYIRILRSMFGSYAKGYHTGTKHSRYKRGRGSYYPDEDLSLKYPQLKLPSIKYIMKKFSVDSIDAVEMQHRLVKQKFGTHPEEFGMLGGGASRKLSKLKDIADTIDKVTDIGETVVNIISRIKGWKEKFRDWYEKRKQVKRVKDMKMAAGGLALAVSEGDIKTQRLIERKIRADALIQGERPFRIIMSAELALAFMDYDISDKLDEVVKKVIRVANFKEIQRVIREKHDRMSLEGIIEQEMYSAGRNIDKWTKKLI